MQWLKVWKWGTWVRTVTAWRWVSACVCHFGHEWQKGVSGLNEGITIPKKKTFCHPRYTCPWKYGIRFWIQIYICWLTGFLFINTLLKINILKIFKKQCPAYCLAHNSHSALTNEQTSLSLTKLDLVGTLWVQGAVVEFLLLADRDIFEGGGLSRSGPPISKLWLQSGLCQFPYLSQNHFTFLCPSGSS